MLNSPTGLPFDDIRELVGSLPESNDSVAAHTLVQLGEADDAVTQFCVWYSRWSGRSPIIHKPLVTLFAGTHGVEQCLNGKETESWLLDEVASIAQGDATVNRLCQLHDAGLKLFDLALSLPVADITSDAALDEKSCAGTIAFGMEAIAGGSDLLGIGAIEKGLSISPIALLCGLGLIAQEELEGVLDPSNYDALQSVLERMSGIKGDGLEILRHLGGRETAAICGAVLAARSQHIPVVIDGLTALAALAVLHQLNDGAIAHCVMAQAFSTGVLNQCAEQLGLDVLYPHKVSDHAGGGVVMGVGFGLSAAKHISVLGEVENRES